jgi:hypothetical protein
MIRRGRHEIGDSPLLLTNLPGYRFDKKKGTVPYFVAER